VKYRKKPVVVEAVQFLGRDVRPVVRGVCLGDGECMHGMGGGFQFGSAHVTTAQGQNVAIAKGEWIIEERVGQSGFYPCKPDIFEATYEPVEEAYPLSRGDA